MNKKIDKGNNDKGLDLVTMLIVDFLSVVLSLIPNLITFGAVGLFLTNSNLNVFLKIFLAPFIVFFIFMTTIFLIRICLPKLKPGQYRRSLNKAVVSWFCHFALGRAAKLSGLIRFFQAFNITKFLYWRALGANVSFYITCSYDIDFVDYPLISIGKGVTIGGATNIICHADIGNYLLLGQVKIEDDVFLAMSNTVGPNTTLKKGAWVGFGNALANQVIEEHEKLKNIRPEQVRG